MAESKKETAHANGNGRHVLSPKDVLSRPRRIEEFTLPGYEEMDGKPAVFRLRELGWREKEEIDLAAVRVVHGPKGEPVQQRDGRMYMPRIVAAAWVDEKGERFLKTLPEAEALAEANLPLIEQLYERAAQMGGFSVEAREEMGKDSKETPTASGGTASASSN